MEELQEKQERWVGDTFVNLCQQYHDYRFKCRADEAPDLVYENSSGNEVRFEITSAYYDNADAKFRWLNAREKPDAPTTWSGVDFNDDLIANINNVVAEKCTKAYGPKCVLLICILPPLTLVDDIQNRLPSIVIPAEHSFDSIYLVGSFGATVRSPAQQCIWRLDS